MRVLQLKELLQLLDGGAKGVSAPDDIALQAKEYARAVWADCGLTSPLPPGMEYCALTQIGTRYLCHFNVGMDDCFLIVVCAVGNSQPEGHLLFDIGGQYRPITFTDLSTDFTGEPTEELLKERLPNLLQGGTPAAILDNSEGSYLQTYQNGPNDYLLEYQLVTTAFHFTTEAPVSAGDILRAFQSYAFGKYEWTRDFTWVHQPLSP